MVDHTANSHPQVQGQGLRNMHNISNSRKSWSRSPMKNRDRMPKSRKCRERSRSAAVRSTFQSSSYQPTYFSNMSTLNVRISFWKNVPSASTLNRYFPMEEGRQ